jgi:hypothetical protein
MAGSDPKLSAAQVAAREQVRRAWAGIERALGKQYPTLRQFLEGAPPAAAMELVHVARDLESEMGAQRRRGAREPWRR